MGKNREKLIYTDKRTSKRAVMSANLGMISLISLAAAIYMSYAHDGETEQRYGFAVLFTLCFSVVGIFLGAVTARNKDYYKFLPVLGIVLNGLSLLIAGFIFRFNAV